MQAWIIIAPEILARASRSLPWRTQMMAFIVSGSSVATGDSKSATRCGARPIAVPSDSSCATKMCEAAAMTASATMACNPAQARFGFFALNFSGSRSSSSSSPAGSAAVISRQT